MLENIGGVERIFFLKIKSFPLKSQQQNPCDLKKNRDTKSTKIFFFLHFSYFQFFRKYLQQSYDYAEATYK